MGDPLVSVVIPTYNRAGLLQRAIDSVLAQTYENLEIIVVDDASTDNTQDVVTSYDDPRVTYICHETNRHGSAARNTGIEAADGEYVAFLDDDDEWYPEKLERQVATLQDAAEDVGMVYCWSDVYAEAADSGRIATNKPTLHGDIFDETLSSNPIGATSTLLIRADVLEEINGFDEDLERGQDSDLIRRVSANHHVDYVSDVLARRWVHDNERIQDEGVENLHASIDCRKKTLNTFSAYLATAPERKAEIQCKIARTYAQTGEWRSCLEWSLSAIRTAPRSQSVYRDLIGVIAQAARTTIKR